MTANPHTQNENNLVRPPASRWIFIITIILIAWVLISIMIGVIGTYIALGVIP